MTYPACSALDSRSPSVSSVPKQKRKFEVEIEAKLTVAAFDEASARKKIAKALAASREVGDDVLATGAVWTYSVTSVDSG